MYVLETCCFLCAMIPSVQFGPPLLAFHRLCKRAHLFIIATYDAVSSRFSVLLFTVIRILTILSKMRIIMHSIETDN